MATTVNRTGVEVREISTQEAWENFDRAARHYLNLSGTEFLQRYEAGDYDDDALEEPHVLHVAMLARYARPPSR